MVSTSVVERWASLLHETSEHDVTITAQDGSCGARGSLLMLASPVVQASLTSAMQEGVKRCIALPDCPLAAVQLSSCLRQVPPPCQPSPLGGGCSNDRDYDDADDNVAGDDDDDDDDGDDDDHEEDEANPLGGGCSNDSDYGDADDNVAGDDDDDDDDGDDDDDHEEEEAELALGQRWDWLQLADFVLNVAQVDRGQEGRTGRL